jgi:hypothetical protein
MKFVGSAEWAAFAQLIDEWLRNVIRCRSDHHGVKRRV